MINEKRIKELADALWDTIIHFQATQESVTAAIRTAYEEGHERGMDAGGELSKDG